MRNPAWRRGSERKTIKVGVLCLLAIAGVSFGSAGKVLPDELTVNVGEVANVGTNVTLVLAKSQISSSGVSN